MNNSPEAIYDTLYIGQRLQNKIEDFTESEIHFFAYFGCLLSLYDGKTTDDWRYSFVKTQLGSPFSHEIQLAIETLNANSSIRNTQNSDNYYMLDTNGSLLLKFLEANISISSSRKTYLNAVCNSISLVPFSYIKDAVSKEPVLHSAGNSQAKRILLENSNPATQVLYSQFKELKLVLEEKYNDLIIPAVVWLEYLNTDMNKFVTK